MFSFVAENIMALLRGNLNCLPLYVHRGSLNCFSINQMCAQNMVNYTKFRSADCCKKLISPNIGPQSQLKPFLCIAQILTIINTEQMHISTWVIANISGTKNVETLALLVFTCFYQIILHHIKMWRHHVERCLHFFGTNLLLSYYSNNMKY